MHEEGLGPRPALVSLLAGMQVSAPPAAVLFALMDNLSSDTDEAAEAAVQIPMTSDCRGHWEWGLKLCPNAPWIVVPLPSRA